MLLIATGVDVNVYNESGLTALMWASVRGYSRMVEVLIEAGADLEAREIEKARVKYLNYDIEYL